LPNRFQHIFTAFINGPMKGIAYGAGAALIAFMGLAVLAFLSALTGCAKSGSELTPSRVVPRENIESCKTRPTEGGLAIMANVNLDDVSTSPFFDKKYDQADLEAVSDASINATVDYVRALGVAVYRVPQAAIKGPAKKPSAGEETCSNYRALKPAPTDVLETWKRATGGDLGTGRVVGLYTDLCGVSWSSLCSETRAVRPTILLDETADRWTLVHEMLHHDFNLQRKATPGTPSNSSLLSTITQNLDQIEKLQNAYKKQLRLSTLLNLAKALDATTRTVYDLLVRTDFEEIAVEGLLVDAYTSGSLKNISDNAVPSALWYMEDARRRGLERLHNLDEHLDFVDAEAQAYLWPLVSAQTIATRAFIQSLESRTSYYVTRAKAGVTRLPKPSSQTPSRTGLTDWLGLAPQFFQGLDALDQAFDDHLETLEGAQALRLFQVRIRQLKQELQPQAPARSSGLRSPSSDPEN
jgi:hypothetical protein